MGGTFNPADYPLLGIRVLRSQVWPEPRVFTSPSGRKVRVTYATAPTFRYVLTFEALRRDTTRETFGVTISIGGTGVSEVTLSDASSVRLYDYLTQGTAYGTVTAKVGNVLTLSRSDTWTAAAATVTRDEAQALLSFISLQLGAWDSFSFVDPYDAMTRTCRFTTSAATLSRVCKDWWALDQLELESLV